MIANFTVSTAHAGVHAYIHTGTFTGIYSCVCEALFPLRSKKKKRAFCVPINVQKFMARTQMDFTLIFLSSLCYTFYIFLVFKAQFHVEHIRIQPSMQYTTN